MDNDTIATIINNKIVNVQPASEFPDFIRFQRCEIYDENGKLTDRYENVPVRFIKILYIGKNGELVEKAEDAVVIIEERFDEYNNRLLIKKEIVNQKKITLQYFLNQSNFILFINMRENKMKLYSPCVFLCIVFVSLSFSQSIAVEQTITIFINNKIKEVKNAKDLPDFYRYKKIFT